MGKYRIRIEAPEEAAERLGALAKEGEACEGFVLLIRNKNSGYSVIEASSPLDLAMMFAYEPTVCAAARAGEALEEIMKAKRDSERNSMFNSMFAEIASKFKVK